MIPSQLRNTLDCTCTLPDDFVSESARFVFIPDCPCSHRCASSSWNLAARYLTITLFIAHLSLYLSYK